MKTKLFLIAAIILIYGCASAPLKLNESGEKVRVLAPNEVSSCRLLGKTSNQVTYALLGVPRHDDVLRRELRIIARNSAARMGGDTIVPFTVMDKGEQTFEVYKCVNPQG